MLYALSVGILLTGIGSAYYHASPNHYTLVWDRIPMTIVFSSFFCLMYGKFLNTKTAYRLWFILIPLGILSVVYWLYSETKSVGDLRPYALIQFLPIVLLLIILFLSTHNTVEIKKKLVPILLFYFAAKFCEHFDYEIYEYSQLISGHPLKHVLASVSTFYMYLMINQDFSSN